MIKSFIQHIKKKQAIYYGYLVTATIKDKEIRLFAKLLLSSGLKINEIKNLKWESLTVIKNILLINNKEDSRIAIAPTYFVDELVKNNKSGFIFREHQNLDVKIIRKTLNNQLLLRSIKLDLGIAIDCDWLENNFNNMNYVPLFAQELFDKHIVQGNKITQNKEITNNEFNKLLEIKSLI
jgi:hypothetical protein